MDESNIIECGGFYFIHNFDSGNLGHVERVPTELIAPCLNQRNNTQEIPDYEFNLWTRPDCAGTEFENGNRTWFNFGIQASVPGCLVRLNLINLNKQGKMYNQGMAPVTRTLPGKPHWERIRDKPLHSTDDNTFTLTFKYRTSENLKATTFFAFTYPFSFAELQIALNSIDMKMLPLPSSPTLDDIYYCRECLIHSLEGRRVDLLTISSHHGISTEREERLKNLFPDNQDRPYKFVNKKVIFISARVHPGETPSSFVFNGFLNLLLMRNDPVAIQLRRLYVFKMIPFLNPDGVARGHYRTDTRGVNLNRVYLNPSLIHHPTIFASRALIRYYHYGYEREDNNDDPKIAVSRSIQNINENLSGQYIDQEMSQKKKRLSPVTSKRDTRKRDKSAKLITGNKSTITIAEVPTSLETLVDLTKRGTRTRTADTSNLAGQQVNDMKLHESSESPSIVEETSTGLLNDKVLRSCLGSSVHLSTSEELKFEGNNPLRPLRDTLKNSITLLMGSGSSASEMSTLIEPRLPNVKMGWCKECRRAIAKLEDTMPGIATMLPGYGATRNSTCHSIDEYREQQRQQLDNQERKDLEASEKGSDTVYFCTNCFKRYVLTDTLEEKECSLTRQSSSVPATTTLMSSLSTTTENSLQAAGDVSLTPSSQKEDSPKSPAPVKHAKKKVVKETIIATKPTYKEPDSGLFLYIDLHGHASKKGIFMYGNHFEDLESSVECMLLPRIMSLNNLHFHFSSCNFTERNMYLKDRRDGMSREGSGRVAVLKATGLVRSYTLECNYNTGRLVNVLPPGVRDAAPPAPPPAQPPKYTPTIFEEVGRSLGASILDLTGQHPNSRIPCSEHRNLSAIREWLRTHSRTIRPQLTMSRLRPKISPSRVPIYQRKAIEDRKENAYAGAKEGEAKRNTALSSRPDVKLNKRNEPVKSSSRTKYDSEPKSKSLATKRRNVLGIRKPNSSKTAVGGAKGKVKRSADDSEGARSKRSVCRAMASSSSDDVSSWEARPSPSGLSECGVGKRRSFAAPQPAVLKKIRLKTAI